MLPKPDQPAVERADTLTVAILAPLVNGLSASASEFGNRNLYFQALYDGLLRAEPDGTIVPWLATEWSYNEDNTVLTMTLRDDVTFTDGTPFNAEAAAQNLIRFRDGVSPDASNLALMTDAVAVDDTTLEITLSAPDPALLNYLARNAGLMQSPATFEAGDPVGTGPYILNQGETVADSVYTFDANPDYWAPEMIKYDKFVHPRHRGSDGDAQRHPGGRGQRRQHHQPRRGPRSRRRRMGPAHPGARLVRSDARRP